MYKCIYLDTYEILLKNFVHILNGWGAHRGGRFLGGFRHTPGGGGAGGGGGGGAGGALAGRGRGEDGGRSTAPAHPPASLNPIGQNVVPLAPGHFTGTPGVFVFGQIYSTYGPFAGFRVAVVCRQPV